MVLAPQGFRPGLRTNAPIRGLKIGLQPLTLVNPHDPGGFGGVLGGGVFGGGVLGGGVFGVVPGVVPGVVAGAPGVPAGMCGVVPAVG